MQLRTVLLCCVLLAMWRGPCQDAAAQITTVRPYKFGFTIDEQQHRQEKRDERGIVMGEFGFITADGIYHVTVYATDEEGKFRILAMRSYPYESPPRTIDMLISTKRKSPPPKAAVLPFTHNFHTEGCSGCFLKNGGEKAKSAAAAGGKEQNVKTEIRTLSKPLVAERPEQPERPESPAGPNTAAHPDPLSPESTSDGGDSGHGQNHVNRPAIKAQTGSSTRSPTAGTKGASPPFAKNTNQQSAAGRTASSGGPLANSKTSGSRGAAGSASPARSFTGSNRSPTTNAVSRAGGEPGDLYRFKYILDYNGHTETGSRNGNKRGNYFSIGDDDVERTIEYIANEFGFQPRIRWRRLDTATKPRENALKEYEFVWFRQLERSEKTEREEKENTPFLV